MRENSKKRIAKEILIFSITVILSILFYISLFPYNHSIGKKVSQINDSIGSIQKKHDSLERTYADKKLTQTNFYLKFDQQFESKYKTSNEFWKRLEYLDSVDSLTNVYNKFKDLRIFLKEFHVYSAQEQNEFFKNAFLTSQEKHNYVLAEKFDSLLKENSHKQRVFSLERKMISWQKQIRLTIYCFFILFSLLFPIRYFIYMIIWSIKILKA